MKFSIITPCYNSEAYLRETMKSVLSQRGDFEIEYILIDGGSTDRTVAIINDYCQQLKSKIMEIDCLNSEIKFLSEKDNGMYDALAKGLMMITGDIVAYINSDDFYLPSAFSTVCDIFEAFREVKWATGMPVCFNKKGQITDCFLPFRYSKSFIQKGIYGTTMPHIQQESTFWRRELVGNLDIGKLREFRFAGDYFIWKTFSKTADLYIIQSCLGGFRDRPMQLSKKTDQYREEFFKIADRNRFPDQAKAHIHRFFSFLMPMTLKRRLNKQILYFEDGHWVKKP